MARNRIRGNSLSFNFAGVAYECDLTSAVLVREAADNNTADGVLTFCDVANASDGNVWKLNVTAVQSTDSGSGSAKSLHTLVWETASAGGDIAFLFKPNGNATATASQPHYSGSVTVTKGAYPEIGGDAGNDSFTWDYSFTVSNNTVTKVTS